MVNDHDSCNIHTRDPKVPGERRKLPFAVIARTGFFVLCSVFKEHLPDEAGPEGDGRERPSQNSE